MLQVDFPNVVGSAGSLLGMGGTTLVDLGVAAAMLVLGLLLGFVGVGGAGFVNALLIGVMGVPVHLAFGTALGAMFATAIAGGVSHLREGNVDLVAGLQIGVAGIVGAYLGGGIALATGATDLKVLSGLTLMASSGMMYWRTRIAGRWEREQKPLPFKSRWRRELPGSAAVGLACGVAAGFLSIGAAPWIQLGFLVLKGANVRRAVGTAMFAMGLMTLSGAVRFAQGGQANPWLLASVVLGLTVGSFLGAKLTKRAPRALLRGAMIATPLIAGSLLVLAPTTG